MYMFLPMLLNSANPLLNEKHVGILMNINNTSRQYGLTITAEDARNIVEVRNTVLRNYGRVDLGIAATGEIMEKFCTSSFIDSGNYLYIINEIQELFYYLKNETEEKIPDDELITLLRELFENYCWGSVEFLKGVVQEYAEAFRKQEQKRDILEKGDAQH